MPDMLAGVDARSLRTVTADLATVVFGRAQDPPLRLGGELGTSSRPQWRDLTPTQASVVPRSLHCGRDDRFGGRDDRCNGRRSESGRGHDATGRDSPAFKLACGIHGIAPLLGQRVSQGEVSFGADLDRWLVTQAERNTIRLQRMHDELLATLGAFQRAKIEVVPLKGSAFLLDDLTAVTWRPMADLDILVRHPNQQDVDLACAHAGYCLYEESWKHRVYAPCDRHPPHLHTDGEHPDNPRDIEVHRAVVEMFRGFRWDITPWIVNNLKHVAGIPVPNDGAMALHLAVHLSISMMEATARMVQVVDFGRQIRPAGVAAIWQAVQKSGSEQYARFVYPAVALTGRWTGEANLTRLEEELRPDVPSAMPAWIAGVDFHDLSWAGRSERRILDRLDLWAHNRRDKAGMLRATLAPTPQHLASAGYPGTGPFAALAWYPAHYRHLLRRVTS